MKLSQVQTILQARVLTTAHNMENEVDSAFCSDMMSNVLAYAGSRSVLITALYNPQVMRTAEMMGIECVIFIGQRDPDPSIIELAEEMEICLMHTICGMFTTCGLLYAGGLRGGHGDAC